MAECPRHGFKQFADAGNGETIIVPEMTRRLHGALRNRYQPSGRDASYWRWIYFDEMRVPGYDDAKTRRLDGWAISKRAPSFEMHAHEVKATRADLLSELRSPEKRGPGLEVSNRFFVVAPFGLVDAVAELPSECGLIEVILSRSGIHDRTRLTVPAPWRDVDPPGLAFLCEVARRSQ